MDIIDIDATPVRSTQEIFEVRDEGYSFAFHDLSCIPVELTTRDVDAIKRIDLTETGIR